MARRKARIPQGKKIQPAVKTMFFTVPDGFSTISLSQCASLMNRRFYRAGLNWAVAGFTFFTQPGQTGNIAVSKIPDTWIASNAWEKGFRAWNELNDRALDEVESIKPRFTDFKVYMDDVHHQSGVGANLLPQDAGTTAVPLGNVYVPGEWDMSSMVIPNQAAPGGSLDFEFVWVGSNYPGVAPGSGKNAVSLIEGYAASRALPDITDPNAPSDAADTTGTTPENWISAIDNESSSQVDRVITDMLEENNQSPYPFENAQIPGAAPGTVFTDTQYPGGANQAPGLQPHDAMLVTATTVGGKTTAPGGNFQGGLIRILNNMNDNEPISMLVHLVPGSHRGYMCQKMQDV